MRACVLCGMYYTCIGDYIHCIKTTRIYNEQELSQWLEIGWLVAQGKYNFNCIRQKNKIKLSTIYHTTEA